MNESTLNQVASQLIKQRRYKKWQIFVSILASIVVFITIYLLILPAITKEPTIYCGYEQHIHTDECYSCYADYSETGIPANHSHKECELTCGIEKHEHTEMCYIYFHDVVIKMSYDSREVYGDSIDNGSDKEDTSDKKDKENKDDEYIVVWERHISVKDGEALINNIDGISKLPNGFEVKDVTWYNAENDKEFSIESAVFDDLELYANFDEEPKENLGDEGLVIMMDNVELYSNGYSSWQSLKDAVSSGVQEITLSSDITAPPGETLESTHNITIDTNGFTLTLSKPMTVSGWSALTIKGEGTIQGNGLDELILVTSSTLNISDVTLTNPGGHCIHLKDWSTYNMYSGSITNSGSAEIDGGGICAETGCGVNIGGGTISNNTAKCGGGIYLSGNSAVNMTNGSIIGNTATDGGGVYFSGGISVFSGGVISENKASSNGGGIYAGSWSKADVKGSVGISGNKAGAHGGGIYADNTVNADPRIAVSGQAFVRDNMLTGVHKSGECVFQDGLSSCKNVAAGTEGLLSITEDAYVEGIVSTDGLGGLIAGAEGNLVLSENQQSDTRIVIETDLILDLNGYTIEYKGSGDASTLFDVAPGITFTILDSSSAKSGSITAKGAEALVIVEENALLNINGGKFVNTDGKHVILVDGLGTVDMSDGILTGASIAEWGGGICAMDGLVYISGGEITKNKVSVGGGGVCCRYLNMSGGKITHNSVEGDNARGGGGINLKKESHSIKTYRLARANSRSNDSEIDEEDEEITNNNFNGIITGGTISNNTSDHVGGGIFIAVGSEMYVKGTTSHIYIENNKALDKKYIYGSALSKGHGFAGGGIFVEHPDDTKGGEAKNGGLLYIYNAVVTNNTALFGGGVAGCGSSSVQVCSNDGVAVYGNHITGAGNGNVAMAHSVDLYCDGRGRVDSMLLGEIQSGWTGKMGENASEDANIQEGAPTLNNFYLKGNALSQDKIDRIDELASVFIRNNESASGGGGIGGNGYIKLGMTAPTGSLILEKTVVDADDGDWSFDFTVIINGEEHLVTLTKEKPSASFDNLPMGTTYSVVEHDVVGYTLISSTNTEGTINGDMITSSFENAVLYTLPDTGDGGTTIYILGGLLLTAAALIYGYRLRYKGKKEGVKKASP